MTQAAITLVLGVIAVATFMLKGKQWPTFITTLVFGLYLGTTTVGQWIMTPVNAFFGWLNGFLA